MTRTVFTQVGRLVRAGGLFVFHVNSLRPPAAFPFNLPAVELEPDFVAEESGQTVRFFSEAYLRELLAGWQQVQLEPVLGSAPHDGRSVQAGIVGSSFTAPRAFTGNPVAAGARDTPTPSRPGASPTRRSLVCCLRERGALAV